MTIKLILLLLLHIIRGVVSNCIVFQNAKVDPKIKILNETFIEVDYKESFSISDFSKITSIAIYKGQTRLASAVKDFHNEMFTKQPYQL